MRIINKIKIDNLPEKDIFKVNGSFSFKALIPEPKYLVNELDPVYSLFVYITNKMANLEAKNAFENILNEYPALSPVSFDFIKGTLTKDDNVIDRLYTDGRNVLNNLMSFGYPNIESWRAEYWGDEQDARNLSSESKCFVFETQRIPTSWLKELAANIPFVFQSLNLSTGDIKFGYSCSGIFETEYYVEPSKIKTFKREMEEFI